MLVCWFVVLLIWSGYRVWRSIAEGDTVYTSVVSKVVTPSYSFTRGPVISRPQDSQEPSSRKQEEGDRDRGQGESPDCCHHCHGVIPVMILLLISADNWGLHGDGENGEDDLSHTISLQLDIYWILRLSTSPHQPQLNITHWWRWRAVTGAGLLLLLAIGHSKKPEVIGFRPSWETFSLIQFFCVPFGA